MKDLNKIRMLSNRLAGGVQEEGVNLALLYIPGLSRYHIVKLVRAGYEDVNSLGGASEGELGQLLPKRLVMRIQEKIKEDNNQQKMLKAKWIVQGENCELGFTSASHNLQPVSASSPSKTENPNSNLKPKNQKQKTVLEISLNRPDRIIFMGKESKVTTIGFSLLYLLAQHRGQVVSYEDILKELWKNEEDAIYTRINYHICKIRKDLSKATNNKGRKVKKIKNIFKTVPGRGLMLDIKEKELEINF